MHTLRNVRPWRRPDIVLAAGMGEAGRRYLCGFPCSRALRPAQNAGRGSLSVWTDETALREFMRTPPHVRLMTSLKPLMGPTKFVTWRISAADGRPNLASALERLASGCTAPRR
jgi:hypothetical protein